MKAHKIILVSLLLLGYARSLDAQTTLFNGKHQDAPYGFTVGYVSKDWRTNIGGHVIHENLWGEENKRMHGVQLGFNYQPCLPFGLGLHTGLFYEFYYSVSKTIKDYGFDDFGEHSLYLPLHGMYRFPLAKKMSFSVFGGAGINWAVYGKYSDAEHRIVGAMNAVALTMGIATGSGLPLDVADLATDVAYPNYWDSKNRYQHYGGGDWPKHFNLQWEVGGTFRYDWVQLGFTYSFGGTNHAFYPGFLTRQDKINISLSFVTDFK